MISPINTPAAKWLGYASPLVWSNTNFVASYLGERCIAQPPFCPSLNFTKSLQGILSHSVLTELPARFFCYSRSPEFEQHT